MDLASVMRAAAQKMLVDFEKTKSVKHQPTKGSARETSVLTEFLQPYLPLRYGVSSAVIVDIESNTSSQQDLVVFDAFNAPIHEDLGSTALISLKNSTQS